MNGMVEPYEMLWAKLDRDTGAWHPLLYHMLDVAAVAGLVWDHCFGLALSGAGS